jgi:hypothetical protein
MQTGLSSIAMLPVSVSGSLLANSGIVSHVRNFFRHSTFITKSKYFRERFVHATGMSAAFALIALQAVVGLTLTASPTGQHIL